MNYPNTRVNVDIPLLGMVCDAAGELERDGYLLEMTTSDGDKVHFKPSDIGGLDGVVFVFSERVMKKLEDSDTDVTSDNAKEVVSKYITVDEIKDYIKSTGNFVKEA